MKPLHFLVLFVSLISSSCSLARFVKIYAGHSPNSGELQGRVFISRDTDYEIGELPPGWTRIKVEGGDLAFYNQDIGATITVNSICGKPRYSYEAIMDALFIGIKDKEEVSRDEPLIDGERGLGVVVKGVIDGVPVVLRGVVVRKGGCVYDFTYGAMPQGFEVGRGEYEGFINGFRVIRAQ
ncbi:MAG: hypothetical protein IH874_08435 [Candidatus Dadabacteria bacterium]|nr:hypothetical protein [Candidatus Dadabacteria bacterium]